MSNQTFLYDPKARPQNFFDEEKGPCLRFTFTDTRSPSALQCEIDRLLTDPFIFNGEEVANLREFIDTVIKELGESTGTDEGSLNDTFIRAVIDKIEKKEPKAVAICNRIVKFKLDAPNFVLLHGILNMIYQHKK
jgi:hypothetical protein